VELTKIDEPERQGVTAAMADLRRHWIERGFPAGDPAGFISEAEVRRVFPPDRQAPRELIELYGSIDFSSTAPPMLIPTYLYLVHPTLARRTWDEEQLVYDRLRRHAADGDEFAQAELDAPSVPFGPADWWLLRKPPWAALLPKDPDAPCPIIWFEDDCARATAFSSIEAMIRTCIDVFDRDTKRTIRPDPSDPLLPTYVDASLLDSENRALREFF